MPKSRDQDYAEWLQREIDQDELQPEDFNTVQRLTDKLAGVFYGEATSLTRSLATPRTDALMGAHQQITGQWAALGIVGKTINFPSWNQLRFTLPQHRGWFNYKNAASVARTLGWKPGSQ